MEKFKNGNVVKYNGGELYIIVSWAMGDNSNTFQGTVIKNDEGGYPVGDHSRTWHEEKFELAPKGLKFEITT